MISSKILLICLSDESFCIFVKFHKTRCIFCSWLIVFFINNSFSSSENYFILGGDNLEKLPNWENATKCLNNNIIAIKRGKNLASIIAGNKLLEENKNKLLENINNGKGYDKFLELVNNQGGDISYLENLDKFEKAKYIEPIIAQSSGFINEINAEDIGKVACGLGAGRIRKEDRIDYSVGIVLDKKVSAKVEKGEVIGYIHANDLQKLTIAKEQIKNIIKISSNQVKAETIIFEIIK